MKKKDYEKTFDLVTIICCILYVAIHIGFLIWLWYLVKWYLGI